MTLRSRFVGREHMRSIYGKPHVERRFNFSSHTVFRQAVGMFPQISHLESQPTTAGNSNQHLTTCTNAFLTMLI